MKIYMYYLLDDNSIGMYECDVRETPKTYSRIGGKTLVRKENVNRAVPHGTPEYARRCFLTENNYDKAMEILIEQDRMYVEWMKNKYEKFMMEKCNNYRLKANFKR